MKISLICVGAIKEKYLKEAIADYAKRLSKYCLLEIIEVKDESNAKDEVSIKKIEAERIITKIPKNSYIILCDLYGEELDSISFSKKLDEINTYNNSHITFIIGGSLGFGSDIYKLCNYKIKFSKMTFPHQLMRLFLIEQIYRAHKILNNETYHK